MQKLGGRGNFSYKKAKLMSRWISLGNWANTIYGRLKIKFWTKPIYVFYEIFLVSTKVLVFFFFINQTKPTLNIEFIQYWLDSVSWVPPKSEQVPFFLPTATDSFWRDPSLSLSLYFSFFFFFEVTFCV